MNAERHAANVMLKLQLVTTTHGNLNTAHMNLNTTLVNTPDVANTHDVNIGDVYCVVPDVNLIDLNTTHANLNTRLNLNTPQLQMADPDVHVNTTPVNLNVTYVNSIGT